MQSETMVTCGGEGTSQTNVASTQILFRCDQKSTTSYIATIRHINNQILLYTTRLAAGHQFGRLLAQLVLFRLRSRSHKSMHR